MNELYIIKKNLIKEWIMCVVLMVGGLGMWFRLLICDLFKLMVLILNCLIVEYIINFLKKY